MKHSTQISGSESATDISGSESATDISGSESATDSTLVGLRALQIPH